MVLQGWRIDMYCDPNEQPAGEICNSNGIWPYNLQISLDDCNVGDSLTCTLNFYLLRSCDPSCAYGENLGIDKAFNHVMNYDIYIYSNAIFGENLNVKLLENINAEKITSEGNTYGTVVAQGDFGFDAATVALRGFNFTLSPLKDDSIFSGKPGRYLESLTFRLQDILYSTFENQLAFNWTMGYYTPLTTFPSHGAFGMSPTLIQVKKPASILHTPLSPAGGAVCVSDKFFKCELNIDGVKLKQTTNTMVTVNVQV